MPDAPTILANLSHQAVEERPLSGNDLVPGEVKSEPFSAVDFAKGPPPAASGRPLNLERVASDQRGVKIALGGKGIDPLATRLLDLSERNQTLSGRGHANFFLEFAQGGRVQRFV